MFIGATMFFHYLKSVRAASIVGVTRSGKTSLAFAIAYELLRSGWAKHLISNCPSVWNEDLTTLQIPDIKRSGIVAIIDEGGMWLKRRSDTHDLVAFRGKMDLTFLIPSTEPPSPDLRVITVQRIYQLSGLGLPLWIYSASLDYGKISEQTTFGWLNPQSIYGCYDTLSTPIDESGIDTFLLSLKQQVTGGKYVTGKASRYSRNVGSLAGLSDPGGSLDDFTEAAETMARAASAVEKAAVKLSKKRKKRLFGIF